MRFAPWIIVGMGVCCAALVLFERDIASELRRLDARLMEEKKDNGWQTADVEPLENRRTQLKICGWLFGVLGLAGIALLGVWFVKVSRYVPRHSAHYSTRPSDEFAIMSRLSDQQRSHFQFGIASLLALALAVSIACAALVYPMK
jgi:hypothetical protein